MPVSPAADPSTESKLPATVPSPPDTPMPPVCSVPERRVADASAPAPLSAEHCTNCGGLLSSRYCPDCGQRVEHSVHSVSHFLREATEDLTHADSRLWRTMAALLFKPGFLTREFLDGRRARYLPPVRLYLVLSVLFFLTAGSGAVQLPPAADGPNASAHGHVVLPGTAGCGWTEYHGAASTWLAPMLRASCEKVAADRGRALDEQFNHTLPRALFVFLPLFALLMKALYRRPPRYYVEHLLFFIHDHAAAFLLMSLAWLVEALRAPQVVVGLADTLVGIYLPIYLYQSMRRMYGQGAVLTLVKFIGLALAYLVLGSFTMAMVAVYSYLTL